MTPLLHSVQLIEDLLNLASLGRVALRRSKVDLSALAREIFDELYASSPRTQVKLLIEGQMSARDWATGEHFTMADCAAAPALFYASIVHPFRNDHRHLTRYRDRLLERPSVKRVIAEARPYFSMFPYRDVMPARYLADFGRCPVTRLPSRCCGPPA